MRNRLAALGAALLIALPAGATLARQHSEADPRTSGSPAIDRHLEELDELIDTALEGANDETVTVSRTRLEQIDFHVEQIKKLLLVQP
jgi:hypothetical protein